MNKYVILGLLIACLSGCKSKPNNGISNPAESTTVIEPVSINIFTRNVELFAEFKPFVVGQESAFAAHLNDLEEFKPLRSGSLSVILQNEKNKYVNTVDAPSVPGIYRPVITPSEPGIYSLTFNFSNDKFNESINIDSINVYQNISEVPVGESGDAGDKIVYLKEQAWKVEFATKPVSYEQFNEIIKTTGEILPALGDEMVVVAGNSGIINFGGNKTIPGSYVNSGDLLFTVSGSNLTDDNAETLFKQAKATFEKASADYERGQELVKENIVSRKEFQEIKTRYESEQAKFNNLARNYKEGGQKVISPMSGYIKNIKVSEGEYVSAGQPLAVISQNRRLLIRAEVSQRYFSKLPALVSANFRTVYDNKTYSLESFNGQLLSYGKSNDVSTLFIPVTFSFDNRAEIVPGSLVEVFLKLKPLDSALVIPITSLIEEQGLIYAYVQTAGESFSKRELTVGGTDGIYIQVLSGLKAGERVVIRGPYQIKLASASGTIPAHGHAH